MHLNSRVAPDSTRQVTRGALHDLLTAIWEARSVGMLSASLVRVFLFLRFEVEHVTSRWRFFEMPRRGRTSIQKNSSETTVVQFSGSPPTLAVRARAGKVSQKLEQKAHPVISSGADPGPAGFDWEELKSMDDKD